MSEVELQKDTQSSEDANGKANSNGPHNIWLMLFARELVELVAHPSALHSTSCQ
ncbi:MAG: hypothetical protein ACKESB_01845 [Candidatus Hodgkinia cicadicola]